jgi:hypothetical protein
VRLGSASATLLLTTGVGAPRSFSVIRTGPDVCCCCNVPGGRVQEHRCFKRQLSRRERCVSAIHGEGHCEMRVRVGKRVTAGALLHRPHLGPHSAPFRAQQRRIRAHGDRASLARRSCAGVRGSSACTSLRAIPEVRIRPGVRGAPFPLTRSTRHRFSPRRASETVGTQHHNNCCIMRGWGRNDLTAATRGADVDAAAGDFLVPAGPFVIAIALAVIAPIVPSSVRHRPCLAHSSRRLGGP